MGKAWPAKALQLLGLSLQHIHILTNDFAADRFEHQPHQAADGAKAESNHRIDFCLILGDRRALGGDDEVAVRAKVVVNPAHIGHDEPVGVGQLTAFRKEEPRYQALRDWLSLKLYCDVFAVRAHQCLELTLIMVAKPSLMHKDGVRAIQKILKAGLDGSGKTRFHPEAGPSTFAVVRKPERFFHREVLSQIGPHKTISFANWKPADSVPGELAVDAQGGHDDTCAASVILPPVVGTLETIANDFSLRQRHVAMRAAVLECNQFSSLSTKQDNMFSINTCRHGTRANIRVLRRDVPIILQRHDYLVPLRYRNV